MPRHRRPSTSIIERVGKAIKQSPTKDWNGRLPAVNKSVAGGFGGTQIVGGDNQVNIEHVGTSAVADQSIAAGGARIRWTGVAGPPEEIRGFNTFQTQLAADDEVTDVPCDITGVLTITLSGEWQSYTGCDTITIIRTRDGVEESKVFTLGPVESEVFD